MDDTWQVVCWRLQPSDDGSSECQWISDFLLNYEDANAFMDQMYSPMEATGKLEEFLRDFDMEVSANQ
eukprot:12159655-Karenia_brevis.AAC.1